MCDQPLNPWRPRRLRWLQFSLRSLLAVMLLASLFLAWWHRSREQVIREETALRLLAEIPAPAYDDFYDPVPLVRAVNHLHSMGRNDALKALRRAAMSSNNAETQRSLQYVIPLLFDRRESEDKLPEPKPAGKSGEYMLTLDHWNLPIDMQRDVPFRTKNYFERPDSNAYLVEWAAREGRFRTMRLRPADDLLSAADDSVQHLKSQAFESTDQKWWIRYNIRRQAYSALQPAVWPDDLQAARKYNWDDKSWAKLKEQCRTLGVLWSEHQQAYVATRPEKSAATGIQDR